MQIYKAACSIGICLNWLKVPAGDSRDPLGRGRFLAFRPEQHLFSGPPSQYYNWIYFPEERVRITSVLQYKYFNNLDAFDENLYSYFCTGFKVLFGSSDYFSLRSS
jgi:hypothetical protein